ncbi:MAG TPA: 4Fe-4S dicluster domain-containing protein [Gaiellaceae bacterium]|nr:4Fe-4S dicluster domain-containing protein [Gaiellaceae bacterium]
MQVLEHTALGELLSALRARGYRLAGPTIRERAIVYEEIHSADDLPAGWTDEQEAGRYRLHRREDDALFGYAVGPQSWKRILHPPIVRTLRTRRNGETAEIEVVPEPEAEESPDRWAFVGVRSCDLHAIAKLDRVFLGGRFVNPLYEAQRGRIFVVAVNCGVAGGTCFCVSMGTGPKATFGFDLALTEVLDGDRHHFVVEAASDAGQNVLAELPTREASADEIEEGERVVERTAEGMGRRLETEGLPELLAENREHARWDEVAERCLTCGNCTMVCPTCFCTTVEDVTDLAGNEAERIQRWDSCFTMDFTNLHGGGVRVSPRSRYRQWLTHKLGTWHDQFGESGCVGCGRCITWCPVGIDITEEAAAIRGEEVHRANA